VDTEPNYETERKFLVRGTAWRGSDEGTAITQGYLTTDPEKTIRIRLHGNRAVLTVKGASERDRRIEAESDLSDVAAAKTMLACFAVGTAVEKRRHIIDVRGFRWEVDEFLAANAGLVTAELEAPETKTAEEAEEFFGSALSEENRPVWLGPEVTTDRRYANSRLSERPFSTWPTEDRAQMDDLRSVR